MPVATILALAVMAPVFCLLGSAKLLAHPSMRSRADHLGFSVRSFRLIGFVELLGICGTLTGLCLPLLGAVSASGLAVLTTAGALAHLRSGDPLVRAIPALVMAAVSGCAAVLYTFSALA